MKQQIAHIIITLLTSLNAWSQTTVTGTVTDGREPLAGANVFIMGTIDGCMTDSLGQFSFKTSQTGELTLRATFMGFDDYTLTTTQPTGLTIRMKERATAIDEVVVTASTYSFGKSDHFKTMDAHDVVMSGNSCGDIVAALQSLPGTQKVGEDGKLYVRGGESEECQTFVNGMHVLVPYSTNVENTASRGRFSPFLFKDANITWLVSPETASFISAFLFHLKIIKRMTFQIFNHRVLAIALFMMASVCANAQQSASMQQLIGQSLMKIDQQKPETFLNCVAEMKRIDVMYPDSVAPKYQMALQSLYYAVLNPQAEPTEGLLAETEQTITKMETMAKADQSDLCTLKGFLYMVRIVQNPAVNGQRYYIQVMENYEKALKLNPDNMLAKQLLEKFFEGMRQHQ